jgi:hypothetical protein
MNMVKYQGATQAPKVHIWLSGLAQLRRTQQNMLQPLSHAL